MKNNRTPKEKAIFGGLSGGNYSPLILMRKRDSASRVSFSLPINDPNVTSIKH